LTQKYHIQEFDTMIWPSISTFLLFVLYTIDFVHGQSGTDCSYNTQTVILEIQLDENTNETGYSLICDDEIIWNVPVGTLLDRPAGTWIVEQSCVDKNVTVCDYTIEDSGGDGFTGGEYGFFTLVFDATTVAFSEYGKLEPFTKRSYCFGTGCIIRPIEEKEDSDVTSEWVVNITTIMPISKDKKSNEETNDSSNWVVNVTVIENDKDEQMNNDEPATTTNITTVNDTDDTKNTDNVNDAPSRANQTSNKIDTPSSSQSLSIVWIASIVGCILIGVITICWFLFLRWKNGQDNKDKPLPLNSNTRVQHNEIDDEEEEDDDDYKVKTVIDNVQYSETMITYDSSDNTVVRTV
jgi:hypothetical protein